MFQVISLTTRSVHRVTPASAHYFCLLYHLTEALTGNTWTATGVTKLYSKWLRNHQYSPAPRHQPLMFFHDVFFIFFGVGGGVTQHACHFLISLWLTLMEVDGN